MAKVENSDSVGSGPKVLACQPKHVAPVGDLREQLREAGLRPTRQRLALAEILFGSGDRHLTAETLYEEARATRYPPSLATIYNTLNQFAERGLVREIALYGSRVWYDTKTGPHYHFYIEDKDELFDIPEELVPALNIPAPDGTQISGIDVVIRLKSIRRRPPT